MPRALLAATLLLLTLACGGDAAPPAPPPEPPCPGPPADYLTNPPQQLSGYCLVSSTGGRITVRNGAVPYALNTPLFSDYAAKDRALWLPPGAQAGWRDTGPLDLPVGSLVFKTFSFPADLRAPTQAVRVVETRVLMRTAAGWQAFPYLWSADGTDAALTPEGAQVAVSWLDASGQAQGTTYLVPNKNQCSRCHNTGTAPGLQLIGPTAAQLRRDFPYPEGEEDQLARWRRTGLLAGAPADVAPLPVWDVPATGSVEARARAYLDVNCAHCHSPTGPARTTGLFLNLAETRPLHLGVCKVPVAAGQGSGGLAYGVVPGQPDQSILAYRMAATAPSVAMPELGRSVVHAEGLALVREWISSMQGSCE